MPPGYAANEIKAADEKKVGKQNARKSIKARTRYATNAADAMAKTQG